MQPVVTCCIISSTCSMFSGGNSHVKPLGLHVKPMLRLHVALYITEGPGRQAGGHWRENQKTFHP